MRYIKQLNVRLEFIREHSDNEDIFRLYIAMDNTALMECLKSIQQLLDDENDLGHREA